MNRTELDEVARTLADGLRESLCSNRPQFFVQLLRLLAEGRPVSAEQLVTTADFCGDDLTAALRQLPSIEFDPEGNVVGLGLTLTPTPHRFQVGGHQLFTWCALDTLFIPAVIGRTARVESPCPVTGVNVQLTVTPEGVENIDPIAAVVSIVVPDESAACCDVRGAFCNHVHFFSSSEAASTWRTEYQEAIILPVHDAYQLGQMFAEHLLGVTEQGART